MDLRKKRKSDRSDESSEQIKKSKYIQKLDFKDNQNLIDILDNDQHTPGVFNILDDYCTSAGTDDGLLTRIKKIHEKNQFFTTPKFAGTPCFTIVHTA